MDTTRPSEIKPAEIERISEQLRSSKPLDLEPFMRCEDYSVSRETFSLFRDPERDLLVTVPQPSGQDLPRYYESEDYISHTDSKRNLTEQVYHWVRSYSLKKKQKLVSRVNHGTGSLLDIGCGTGDFLKECETTGWSVAGIEPNEKARELAAGKTNTDNYFQSIDELIDSKPQSFDMITLWHVLEHIPNLYDFIDKIRSVLKPEGVIVVAVPNFKSRDAKHYGSAWAAFDVPRHLWHFSRKSMDRIFSDFEMKVLEELPMIFDSFYVSLLSEKYKNGRQNFFSAFANGLQSNLDARSSGEYSSIIYLVK